MEDASKYEAYAKRVRIFEGLSTEDVGAVLRGGHVIDFRSGETVFHEGMLGSNLFVVLNGEIEIRSRNKPIARCRVGDAFGEMAVLNNRPRNATAVAIKKSRLLTLDERQINDMLAKHVAVKVLLNIIHVLSERLENANAMLTRHRPAG